MAAYYTNLNNTTVAGQQATYNNLMSMDIDMPVEMDRTVSHGSIGTSDFLVRCHAK